VIERFVFVVIIAAASVLAYRLLSRRQLRRAMVAAPTDSVLRDFRPGVPAIVYFTTPYCGPCETQQTPALRRLEAELGDRVQIFRVDATQDAEAAERWGVFSVPTTFVLDGDGQPRQVNHGVADASKLRSQLEAFAAHRS